jgi:hypothetical protein
VYQPLRDATKCIRLLKLAPGAYNDPLVAELFEIDLKEARGTYTALSYTWGSQADWKHRLLIEGSEFLIGNNLADALHRIRSETSTTTVWADAVCINQWDHAEKLHQVNLMSKIYADAPKVFSWLGQATPHSPTGMDILSYLAGHDTFDHESPWERMPDNAMIQGLEDILGRDYFSRVWVVQEAALSGHVRMQVGDLSVEWHAADAQRFLARIKLLEVSPAWQASGSRLREVDFRPLRELLEQSVSLDDRRNRRTRPATLLDVVHAMRHRQSMDPRDKIYAMMGLAHPAEVANFVPDYSTSWEETYRRFFDFVSERVMESPLEVWNPIRQS